MDTRSILDSFFLRMVLILSLATGYKHGVIPHVEQVVQLLGEKRNLWPAPVILPAKQGGFTALRSGHPYRFAVLLSRPRAVSAVIRYK